MKTQADLHPTKYQNRLDWVDVAKGIGIIFVVLGHLTYAPQGDWVHIKNAIYLFHMPLFFILSGYTFSQKPNQGFAKRRASTILVPYVAFMLLVMAADYVWCQLNGLDPFVNFARPLEVIARPLIGGGALYSPLTAYWYLTCFYMVVVMYNMIANTQTGSTFVGSTLIAFGMLGLGLGASYFLPLNLPIGKVFSLNPLGILAIPTGFFFFWVGQNFNRFNPPPSAIIPLIVIGIAAALFAGRFDLKNALSGNLYNPVAAVGLSLLVISTSKIIAGHANYSKRVLLILGNASLSILALHTLFLKHINVAEHQILAAIIAIAASVFFHYFAASYPRLKILFLGGRG